MAAQPPGPPMAGPPDIMPGALKTKAETNYRKAESPARSCGTCGSFTPPDQCSLIENPVAANMVCDLFNRK